MSWWAVLGLATTSVLVGIIGGVAVFCITEGKAAR